GAGSRAGADAAAPPADRRPCPRPCAAALHRGRHDRWLSEGLYRPAVSAARLKRKMPGRRPGHLRHDRSRIVLPEGNGVHQAAAGPQVVESAVQLDRAALADIAFEALAVIADLLDHVVGPFLVEADALAEAGRDAEE